MKTKIALTTLMLSLLILLPSAVAAQTQATVEIEGSATVIEEDRGAALLVATTDGRTERGDFVEGEVLDPNDTILEGSFSNQSGSSLLVANADGRVSVLEANAVGMVVADGIICSVSCQDGYFACCEDNTIFVDECHCLKNGSDDSGCDHGGAGSSSCTLGSG